MRAKNTRQQRFGTTVWVQWPTVSMLVRLSAKEERKKESISLEHTTRGADSARTQCWSLEVVVWWAQGADMCHEDPGNAGMRRVMM